MRKLTSIVLLIFIGAFYVLCTVMIMDLFVWGLGEMIEPHHKMIFVGGSAFIASLVIHLLNGQATNISAIQVATAMAAAAFLYFYVFKPGIDKLHLLPTIFFTNYSAFAFVAILGMPFLVGIALDKSGLGTALQPPQP